MPQEFLLPIFRRAIYTAMIQFREGLLTIACPVSSQPKEELQLPD